MRTTIKIGDKIKYRIYGGIAKVSTVDSIQICMPGEKYGTEVNVCNIVKHPHGTVALRDMHWCWFEDILEIYSKKKPNENSRNNGLHHSP